MAGNIEKRSENTWRVRVFLGRDAEGKQETHRHTVHGTKKDAQAYLNKVLRERDLGTWAAPSLESVAVYLDRWLTEAAIPRIAPATADMYEDFLRRHVRPGIGGMRLDKLSPLDVQGFYGGLAAKGLGPAIIRRIHGMLSSALNQAVRWGMIQRNPASLVDLPRVPKREMTALDPDQAARFLEAASCDRHAALWAFLLETGVRPGEALALRWLDLDLKAGTVTIRRSLTWRRGGVFLFRDETKTGNGRQIPLSPELMADFREHRRRQVEERLAAGPAWEDHDLVFCTEGGTPHRRENLTTRHLKPILKAAGLPASFRLYDCRHSCATLALASKMHPKVVAERLGHASVTHTLDTYSHVTPTMQAEATETLAGLLYRRA